MSDRPDARTLVLGLGNPLMGDDGLGLALLEGLRAGWQCEPAVDLVDGGTWGMNLLPTIEQASRVLLLDAINVGREPGSLVVLQRDELPRLFALKISPHQIDLREVLALAELRGTLPAEITAVGLQPAVIDMRTELSPALVERLPDVIGLVRDILEDWGHRMTPLPEPAHA